MACASQMTEEAGDLLAFVQVLLELSPEQVRCSQFLSGHTPLRDAVRNPSCSAAVIELLLHADKMLKDKYPPETVRLSPAVQQPDRDGLYPVDHLIKAIHLGWSSSPGLVSILPKLIVGSNDGESDPTNIEKSTLLVRLFSLGNYFSLLPGASALPSSQSARVDQPRLTRILECTHSLLEQDTALVYQYSQVTGCSPLHVALRNYGNFPDLISSLMEKDTDGSVIRHRNHYGDLPLHVACAAGVPMDILRLVLAQTLSASDSVNCEPHSLIWSMNQSGYTPIDLEWIRHIEAGHGFFSHRSFLPLDVRGIRKTNSRYDELYNSLLRQAADEAVSAPPIADKTFGLLLHRIFLIIRVAFRDSFTSSPFDLPGVILHQAAALSGPTGPLLPKPILDLILSQQKEHLENRDHLGKTPLHHAVQVRKATSLTSEKALIEWKVWVKKLLYDAPQGCTISDSMGRLPLHCALDFGGREYTDSLKEARAEIVKDLVTTSPKSTETRDPVSGFHPFMQAAVCPGVPLETVYWLLKRSPGVIGAG